MESDLQFAGFIAFTCKTRSDSPTVVKALLQSGHSVTMLTGDAPLTAYHVAKTVGLCHRHSTPPYTLKQEGSKFEWVGMLASDADQRVPFSPDTVRELSTKHDLVVIEGVWDSACEQFPDAWLSVDGIRVFARCSPHGKARVIRHLQVPLRLHCYSV